MKDQYDVERALLATDTLHDDMSTPPNVPGVRNISTSPVLTMERIKSFVVLVLFLANCSLLVAVYYLYQVSSGIQPLGVERWTSDLDDVAGLEYMTLNSSFDTHNKYVGEPSTELDAAWQELWHVYPGQMTEEEVLQSGNDPHLTAKWPEEYGGGYVFKIEAFHQMHCLDFIRKAARLEYYADVDPMFSGVPKAIVQEHFDHCVETLRNVIKCAGDTTPKTFVWVDGYHVPYPYNVVQRQCRNYDKLLDWAHDRSPPHEVFVALNRSDSEYVWPNFP